MGLMPMKLQDVSDVPYKVVTYTNPTAVTIAAGQSTYISNLTTTDTDMSGYIAVGVTGFNLYGGASYELSLKALAVPGTEPSSISAAIANPRSTSVTIPAGAITINVRCLKFVY